MDIDRVMLSDASLLKRLVVQRCLYGVDLNPSAIELAKMSLWLVGEMVGETLGSLDRHLRCGNSLIGLSLDVLERSSIGSQTNGQPDALASSNVLLPLPEKTPYNSPPWEGGVGGVGRQRTHSAGTVAPQPLSAGERFVVELPISDGQCPPPHPPLPKGGSYELRPLPKDTAPGDTVRTPDTGRNKLTPRPSWKESPKGGWDEAHECATPVSGARNVVSEPRRSPLISAEHALDLLTAEAFSAIGAKRRVNTEHAASSTHEDNERLILAATLRTDPRLSFFHWDFAFPEVFLDRPGAKKGFDAVIGNPPYVRMELIKPLKPFLKRHYACHSDRADLYIYFYERAVTLLRPGGRLAFIASSTWARTKAGANLRSFLKSETKLDSFVDFGDLPLFEGVTAYPCILVATHERPTGDSTFACAVVQPPLPDNLAEYLHNCRTLVPQAELDPNGWHLENGASARLRQKLLERGTPLKQYCGAPLYGIKTGLNEAFVINSHHRDQLIADDPKSAEILKPFLEGKDLKAWRIESRGLWLIYTHRGVNIEHYPAIEAHLRRFKTRLEARATRDHHAWYELQQPQARYAAQFGRPKIIYSRFVNTPMFARDDQGYFLNNALSTMTVDDPILLYCLMSPVAWFLLEQSAAPMANGYRQLHGHVVERLPIPRFTTSEQRDIRQWVDEVDTSSTGGPLSWAPLYRAFGLTASEMDMILGHRSGQTDFGVSSGSGQVVAHEGRGIRRASGR